MSATSHLAPLEVLPFVICCPQKSRLIQHPLHIRLLPRRYIILLSSFQALNLASETNWVLRVWGEACLSPGRDASVYDMLRKTQNMLILSFNVFCRTHFTSTPSFFLTFFHCLFCFINPSSLSFLVNFFRSLAYAYFYYAFQVSYFTLVFVCIPGLHVFMDHCSTLVWCIIFLLLFRFEDIRYAS